jgi:hypothetical protein
MDDQLRHLRPVPAADATAALDRNEHVGAPVGLQV